MAKRDWKQRMWRRIVLRTMILLTILSAAALGIWGFLLPYLRAESTMKTGQPLVMQHLQDGGISVTWPAAERTDYYLVEVLRPEQVQNKKGEMETVLQPIFTQEIADSVSCILRDLPLEEELTLRINTMVRYENPDEIRVRPGENPLEVVMKLAPPQVRDIQWKADPEQDTVALNFAMVPGDRGRLWYHTGDENWQELKSLPSGETTVHFGQNGDLPMPEHGETYHFRLDSLREKPESIYYSRVSESFQVVREDLLGRDLWVQLNDQGDNVCSLVWNETKGEYYELQMKDSPKADWVVLETVPRDGDRSYTTGHLKPFREYSFRVIAKGGDAVLNKAAAASETITFRTREAVLYSTIWPIKELSVYADPEMTEEIGKVSGGKTLCVVEKHETTFGIRFSQDVTGYIDCRYVMINLPEYLGDLCAYDITNSYRSRYMINEYEMEDITDEVIIGYEHVRMADGTYLAPLLYPVAQRLLVAAQSAREAGYRLKIYDSYRPNRSTEMLYDMAEEMLEEPIPDEIPDPTEEDPERLLTFGAVMTDHGKYPLNYFLAKGASLHNLGIALDLTIETWDTRVEQPMQSEIHDLSHFSMVYRNNNNAKLLKKFMEGAGFGGLVSEWWHFQDNEIRNELKLPALRGGITPEGWKLSDGGWRYRLKNGTYATGTLQLGDVQYTFDEAGYLIS